MRLLAITTPLLFALATDALCAETTSAEGDRVVLVEDTSREHSDARAHVVKLDRTIRPTDGLGEVLAAVPGLRTTSMGGLGAFTGVSMRGTPFRQSTIWLDGIPLNPDGVEAVDLSRWPLAGLQEVRVYRGRPPAMLGGAPIGGAIELVTEDVAQAPLVQMGAGSYGSTRGLASVGVARDDKQPFALHASVDLLATQAHYPYFDDQATRYEASDDVWRQRENSDRRQLSTLITAHVAENHAGVRVLSAFSAREEGLPGPVGRIQLNARLASLRHLGVVRGEGVVANTRLEGHLWHDLRRERLRDASGDLHLLDGEQHDAYDTVGAAFSFQSAFTPNLALRGSVTGRYEGFVRRLAGRSLDQRHDRGVFGVALDLPSAWWHGLMSLTPAVDLRVLVPGDDAKTPVFAANPGLVVAFTPHEALDLWVGATRAFRPPDMTELYGDQGQMHGNPNLKPERAIRVEAGLSAHGTVADVALHGEITGFSRWSSDQIGWLQNTQRTLVAVNFGETRTAGLEAAFGLGWARRVEIDAQLTWLDAKQTVEDATLHGKPVPFVPALHTHARLTGRPWLLWELGTDLDQQSAVGVDPQGVLTQPARVLLGVFTSVQIPKTPVKLSLDVRNLLDTRTARVPRDVFANDGVKVPSPITDLVGYPLPGRTFWVSIAIDFSK